MKFQATILALAGFSAARDVTIYSSKAKREVPQEHSHEAILATTTKNLQLNNPQGIVDGVFSLLGNAAAAKGAGSVTNLDCLQQAVADQAFTNAKAAGDVDGQANAIMFRALERNTGGVGTASVLCNETAANPEIAAITQHQDPASKEASGNKQIALDVAKQLSSIGADPNLAIQTGTFKAGDVTDNTGKGFTCDDANDAVGCIISQNLLVPDVTEAEIKAALAGSGAATGAVASNSTSNASNVTANASGCNTKRSTRMRKLHTRQNSTSGTNIQTFTGDLGGAAPAVIQSDSERPFSVNGATFLNKGAALQRSCAVQHNACASAANAKSITASVSDCGDQETACNAAATAAARKNKKLRMRQAAVDTGSCGSPAVKFAAGLDGRKENAFAPVNGADFNHGSALNIKVVSDFICQQLQSKCKASADAVAACTDASTAASAQKGQAAADTFNGALGVTA